MPILPEHNLRPDASGAEGLPALGPTTSLSLLGALFLVLVLLPACDTVGGSEDDETALPPPPTALEAAPKDGAVHLNWMASEAADLDGYRVYRDTAAGFVVSEDVAPISGEAPFGESDYEDTSVENGTTYYYRVTAVDASANESKVSDAVEATPLPNPPDRP